MIPCKQPKIVNRFLQKKNQAKLWSHRSQQHKRHIFLFGCGLCYTKFPKSCPQGLEITTNSSNIDTN